MQLTTEQLTDFHQQGWLVLEGVFAPPEAESIADLAVTLCRQDLLSGGEGETADHTNGGEAIPRKLSRPFLRHEAFRQFALNPRLQSIIEQLIGHPPLLMVDQVFLKPPKFGSAKPWHQDNAYFQCDPADELITAWIALDDADEDNGCLRYISGSHTQPLLEHTALADEPHNWMPSPDEIDLSREYPACVARGGVVFHHSQTLHTSHRNNSDRWRRALATHWASSNVTSQVDTVASGYYRQHQDLYAQAHQSPR